MNRVFVTACLCLVTSLAVGASEPSLRDSSIDAQLETARSHWRERPLLAIDAAERAAAEATRLGDTARRADALRLLARALAKSGSTTEGLEPLREAVALDVARSAFESAAETRLVMAYFARVAGQDELAQSLCDESKAYYANRGDMVGLARVAARESMLAVRRGDHAQAIHLGRRALETVADLAAEQNYALMAASALAYALHQERRWDEAQAEYDRVVALAWAINDQSSLDFAYCNRAEVAWERGNTKPALADLERAIAGLERQRARLRTSLSDQRAFLGEQVLAYDRLIRYFADTYRGIEAFDIAERYHARTLFEGLDPTTTSPHDDASALDVAHDDLVAAIGGVRLDLEHSDSPADQAKLHARLRSLEGQRRHLEAQRARATTSTSPNARTPPDRASVQRDLEPGEVMIVYWLSDDRLFAWALSRDHVDFVHVPVTRSELTATIRAYLEPMRDGQRAQDAALAGREHRHVALGGELYRWLIAPLPRDILKAERLIVVPDGILHYLPFEALIAGPTAPAASPRSNDDSNLVHGTYLGQRFLGLEHAIVYSPSAATYLALRQRGRHPFDSDQPNPSSPSLLALAPALPADDAQVQAAATFGTLRGPTLGPLRYSRGEVERIGALFPNARTLVGDTASELQLKQNASSFRLIHLATHGLVRDELPMSSGVLLRPDATDDGLLQAHEVLDLDLHADLVTLSACRTGRGQLQRGEGLVGLSRAFLRAGASSVLVSLWDVDDRSTPLLMEAFYRGIAGGLDRATALRDARRALFGQRGTTRLAFHERPLSYAHPRYWASFVLIGTP